jgi:hypothetical protein
MAGASLTAREGNAMRSPTPAQRIGLERVEVRGFRSARSVSFAPGAMTALVGEANAGKSNLIAAIRAVLEPEAPPLQASDVAEGGDGTISIRLGLAGGGEAVLEGTPAHHSVDLPSTAPAVLFLPAAERGTVLVAAGVRAGARALPALELFQRALSGRGSSSAAPALAFVEALESCCASGVRGIVLLVEEPELYLRPQAQRYLYRLLRRFAVAGNQVIYSTHSPAFLSVGRLDELVFVERLPQTGTHVAQPEPVTPDEEFRILTEFDAARGELFLAHSVLLVEGQTEKLVFPFVLSALGYDHDREAISIVECGGKPNIPFFVRICRVVGVPFVVVHDSDARRRGRPIASERALNALIAETAGSERTVVLEPDFERVAGIKGRRHKPQRAWRRFATLPADEIPLPLRRAAELAIELAGARPAGQR